MISERILVTGAAGFIARRLVPFLLESGYEVVAVDRLPNPGYDCAHYFEGDLVRDDVLRQIKLPVSKILHLAANVFSCTGPDCFIDNVYATYLVANHALRWNTKRIVLASTSGVYEQLHPDSLVTENHPIRPNDFYGLSKLLAETTLTVSCVGSVVLRFTHLYGEGNTNGAIPRIISAVKKGVAPRVRDENRDYLYIGEAVDAIVRALEYRGPHSMFHFGTGRSIPLPDLARQIILNFGRNLQVHIEGKRNNPVLDCTLARRELSWQSSRNILSDLPLVL